MKSFEVLNRLVLVLLILGAQFTCAAQDDDLQEKFEDATMATGSGDFKKAAKLLLEIEKVDPEFNPQLQLLIGYSLHGSGQYDEAIEYHEKAAASSSEQIKATGLYNLACVYSIKEDSDKSFDYLKKAIKSGFRDSNFAKNDADFKNIQSDDRWNDMIVMMENGGVMPEKKGKKNKLVGTWKMKSGTKAGAKIEDANLSEVVITSKTFTMPGQGDEPFVMSYQVDMDAKPIEIDFKIDSGPMAVGAKAKGIVKMEEDGSMSLCYDARGGERPSGFKSTEENGYFTFKLKKAKGAKKSLAEQMQGKWKCKKGVRSGEEVSEDRMASIITIDEKEIRIPVGEDQAFVMSYSIDESKSPATIDMKIEEGPAPPDSKAVGIVAMKDGKLMLCYDSMGGNRPEKFEAKDDGLFYFEMKKQEK